MNKEDTMDDLEHYLIMRQGLQYITVELIL